MGRLAAVPIILALGVVGCGGSGPAPAPAASGSAAKGPPADRAPTPPAPGAAIPREPAQLASLLQRTTARLHRAIDGWVQRGDGPPRARPPKPVVHLALYEQRIYRRLARRPELAEGTIARLPGPLATRARGNVTAARALLSLAEPVSNPSAFRTRRPPPAGVLLGYFREAERRFGVDWQVLAAVMFVETKFARVTSPSSAGARGPMQFMPATWEAYGMGGDIRDPRDAVLGAANYLHASGAPEDYRRALHAYNHAQPYVDAVLSYAREIRRDPRNYYAYYNWHVFVLTPRGDLRLTGPEPRPHR